MNIKITIEIDDEKLEIVPIPGKEGELQEVLYRALNTWEQPPEWARKLYDKLRDKGGPKK